MQTTDAEDLWLCCIMQAPVYIDASLVREEHLSPRARNVFAEIGRIRAEGWPQITVEQLTGMSATILRTIPRRIHVIDAQGTIEQAEAELIRAWSNAEYARALRHAADLCETEGRDEADRYLWDASERIGTLALGIRWVSMGDAIAQYHKERCEEARTKDTDLGSGMVALDKATKTWYPRRCTVIGAYTNMGKSTLTVQLLTGLALRNRPTALISLEDEPTITAARQVAMVMDEVEVVQRLNGENPQPEDLDALRALLTNDVLHGGLREAPMEMVYGKGWTVDQVCQAIYDAARRGARVAAVDYIQCLSGRGNRSEFIAEAAKRMATAAARVGVHLIIVSQVRRPSEAHKPPRPTMFMLKESGDIENMADYVILVHRPEKGVLVRGQSKTVEPAVAYVDKAKDRRTGKIDLSWTNARYIFSELVDDGDQRAIGQGGYPYEGQD